jgi:hypothetical protein
MNDYPYVIPVNQVTTEIQHLVETYVREQQWNHKYKTVGMRHYVDNY